MILTLLVLGAALAVAPGVLALWRWTDKRYDRAAWASLASQQPSAPAAFSASMIEALPEPAQRFFSFAIAPDTPLKTVAVISMQGDFSLGTKAQPNYLPMRAEQILAAPKGFVWRVVAGRSVRFAGSDGAHGGASWSRFWLQGIVPVARAGNNADHARSAFGRYVAEAVFWTPAALLPRDGVRWEGIDETTARVTMTHQGLTQAVDVTVDATGRPVKIKFERWSNANPSKTFRLQPFGGYLCEFRDFDGFRLPTRVEAGNFFDTDDYFAFFRANVTAIRFP